MMTQKNGEQPQASEKERSAAATENSAEQVPGHEALAKMRSFAERKEEFVAAIKESKD